MSEQTPGAGGVTKVRIEAWIAAVLMVVSFGAGFLIRGIVTEEQPATPIEQQVPGMPAGVVPAPPLTDDQLTGGLPEGHVPVEETSPRDDKNKDKNKDE